MSEKRCPRCGKRYPASYQSCPNCGERGRRRRPATPMEQFVAFVGQNGERIFLGATAFFLLVAIFGMILTRCSSKPDPNPGADSDKQQQQEEDKNPEPVSDPLVISNPTLALTVGESAALTVTGGADAEAAVLWSSSDEETVSVLEGVVNAKKAGTATITGMKGSEQVSCVVTVKEKDPDVEVYLNRTDFTLRAGESFQMQVKERETRKEYTGGVVWSVEDSSVATVSETGLVERVGKGTTKVIATMGTKTLECIVRVS